MKPSLLSLLVGTALVMAIPRVSVACDCKPYSDAERFDSAKAVFLGVATEQATGGKYRLKVEESFKGADHDYLDVFADDGSDCAVRMRVGSRYLVFAGEHTGGLFTGACTTVWDPNEIDRTLSAIRPLTKTERGNHGGESPAVALSIGLAAVLAAALILLAWRRYRRPRGSRPPSSPS
ncbi:MAG TPA: hypothetical protein VGM51_13540 [Armatimonadota bacterium]|jgi:hypothetical protein